MINLTNWKDKLGAFYGIEVPEDPLPPKKSVHPKKYSPQKKSSGQATAPYNFVPLPEKILPAQIQNVDDYREHVNAAGNFSGEISLDIETLTPLFIGGQGSKSFAPADTPIIPGSSLRGMFKNIFKIVTCGTFRGQEDFNDEHIYFRCLMGVGRYPWTKDLNKLYNGRMIHEVRGKDKKTHPAKSARPGFLIKTTDNKFFIAPSIYASDRKDDRILIPEYEKLFNTEIEERNSSCVVWNESPEEAAIDKPDAERRKNVAYIITGSQARYKLLDKEAYERCEDKKRAGKQFIRFTRLDYLDTSRDHWIALPEDVRTSYEHDRNRRGVDLFTHDGFLTRAELEQLTGKKFPEVKTLIPCHFLEERGQITAFGHGQCFRIPYERRIGDALPEKILRLQRKEIVDFADALFGKEKFWASRVYFEDAKPVVETISTLPETKAHPLMQPNPTSYQFYVTQNPNSDKLNHWDSGAQLRGYKLYWHKFLDDWRGSDLWTANNFELKENQKRVSKKQEPLTKDMTPLDKGSKFTAKIRFKNLSKVELGALMMIFDLNGAAANSAYKIGQGKPFGFGSVKIKPTLYVEDADAYTELFDGDGWRNPCREKNPAEYLDEFKNYLATGTTEDFSDTWQKVMDELILILDWSRTTRTKPSDWNKSVEQMRGKIRKNPRGEDTLELDERFKQRVPLPTIKTIFEAVK